MENKRTLETWAHAQSARSLRAEVGQGCLADPWGLQYHAYDMNSKERHRLNPDTDCFITKDLKEQHTLEFQSDYLLVIEEGAMGQAGA